MGITKRHVLGVVLIAALVVAISLVMGLTQGKAGPKAAPIGQWAAGDHHNHTWLSDGEETMADLAEHAFTQYGLDWLGTSDHGAPSLFDPLGKRLRGINGDEDPAPASLDFWLGLRDLEWPVVQQVAADYPGKIMITGVEWGAPVAKNEGDAEAKTAILDDMPNALSDFVYKYDYQSLDISRAVLGITKQNQGPSGYIDGATDLSDNHADTAYSIISHPERDLRWPVKAIRSFNNAAPTVCFGMAGVPGSQKEPFRGGYDAIFDSKGRELDEEVAADWKKVDWKITSPARTYGGADSYTSTLGGVWDALLGEGRHFWIFADSDFHNTEEEFWPGEYNQDHTWVAELTREGVVDGLRSGNSFSAMGQLISELDFRAAKGSASATMGGTLPATAGDSVTVTIRFKSPAKNYNDVTPVVDHVDLITGDVTGMIAPSSPEFATNTTNPSTKVAKRFTSSDWTVDAQGFNVATFTISGIDGDMYLRLRGTNMGLGVKGQTDAAGNPLMDTKSKGTNTPAKAWADIWFYSNPIFIDVN